MKGLHCLAVGLAVIVVGSTPAVVRADVYAQVVNVAKSGSPTGPVFDSPISAMSSITDASASKPYLVKIHPGVYDIGGATLYGKSYVDIEGSGEGVTVIRGIGSYIPTIRLVANEELRSISVTGNSLGVWVAGAATMRFVTVYGVYAFWGIAVDADALLDHVRVSSPGPAVDVSSTGHVVALDHCTLASSDVSLRIDNTGHTVTVNETTINTGSTSAVGLTQNGNTVKITRSSIRSLYGAIRAGNVGGGVGGVLVFDSILDGATVGGVKCAGVVNSSLDPVACPDLR